MPVHHRLPRAGVDRFDSPQPALALLDLVVARPPRPETIVVLLDHDRRGLGIVVVDGTPDPDAVIEVVECLAAAHAGRSECAAMIVASVRPPIPLLAAPDHSLGDVERWMELSTITDDHGLELIEWFVLEEEIACPRDRLGEPPRW